jgi:hypothetical protein
LNDHGLCGLLGLLCLLYKADNLYSPSTDIELESRWALAIIILKISTAFRQIPTNELPRLQADGVVHLGHFLLGLLGRVIN